MARHRPLCGRSRHIVGDDTSLCYPNAWKYRDWIIQALNDDLPYDRFIRLQLAADLLEPDEEANRVALGFVGLGPKYYRRNSPEVMADEWEDRVDVVSRGLLGLTVACARCHDHKFDPIRTEDYYALAGVFASTRLFNQPLSETVEKGKNDEAKKAEDALHILKEGSPTDLPIYIRGDANNKGEVVKRRFLEILDPKKTPFQTGSGRLELANAIADQNNPLTARVIVNRVWGQYFGQSLVPTTSNFGHSARNRPIRNCSMISPSVSWRTAGLSNGCTGKSRSRRHIPKAAEDLRKRNPLTQRTNCSPECPANDSPSSNGGMLS